MRLTKPQTFGIIIVTGVALEVLVCFWFQGPPVRPIGQGSDSTGDVEFSAEAAMKIHAAVFPDKPHPIGSPENAIVRESIVQILIDHGWSVEPAVPFEVTPRRYGAGTNNDDHAKIISPGNILAFRDELSDRKARPLLIVSHYDSCVFGPGAGDAGGCVAAAIEASRCLTVRADEIKRPVHLLLTDGEENGLDGAQHFIQTHPLAALKPIVLNLDARGTAGPVVMFESHAGNLELIRHTVNRFARPRLTGSLFTAIYRRMPNGTDFTIFRDAGCPGLNFALIDGAHRYHRPDDSRINLDQRSVQHFGDTLLSVAREIAVRTDDFSDTSEDGLFFDLLGTSVIVAPLWWNLPLRFIILFIAMQIYGRPLIRTKEFRAVLMVWCTMAAVLPAMAALGYLLSRSILGTSLLPVPFVSWGHWISLSLWIIALLVCGLWMHAMLRRYRSETVWNAFWLAHAATNMVASIAMPEFSYLLFVPAVFAMIVTLTVNDVFLRTAIVTCLSAVLLIPLHHLIAIALGPAAGMLLLPAFSLLSMPLLPAFSRIVTDSRDRTSCRREASGR
jgi:hypothetical protein